MKKLILIFVLLLSCIGASAQTYYRVTGNNVYVRSGAGRNYSPVCHTGAYGSPIDEPFMLWKGAIVIGQGAVRNGYMKVQEASLYAVFWGEGWVSTKYLTKATRCSACKGRGHSSKKCPSCNGQGAHVCCQGVGYVLCNSCHGIGYK